MTVGVGVQDVGIVALGDVGAAGGYHVGDEAMFEVALTELGARGIGRWTVLSADPTDTAGRYGVESVPLFGFAGLATEPERDLRLHQLLADPTEPHFFPRDDPARPIRDALAASAGAVITGGGNLDATWPHHVYERAALVGMARRMGKRVVVSGQGIGPNLDRRCGELVASIIGDADLMSVRDRRSLAQVEQLGQNPARVGVVPDDAAFLTGQPRPDRLASLGLRPGGFVAATFSDHSGVLDPDEFLAQLTRLIDVLGATTGLPVLLMPHQGSGGHRPSGDVAWHSRLARAAGPTVAQLPVLPARETSWITGQAALVVSNRYHPIVFALSGGVPCIGIAVDEYTHRKISGALDLHGLGNWCLPVIGLAENLLDSAVDECWARRAELADVLAGQRDKMWTAAQQHWANVAATMTGASVDSVVRAPEFDSTSPFGGWAARTSEVHRWSNRLARRDGARRRELDDTRARMAHQDLALRIVEEERAVAHDRIAVLRRIVDSEQAAAESARELTGESLDKVREMTRRQEAIVRSAEDLTQQVGVLTRQLKDSQSVVEQLTAQAATTEARRAELERQVNHLDGQAEELDALRTQVRILDGQAQELDALRHTKLLRWSAKPRRFYSMIRRALGRP